MSEKGHTQCLHATKLGKHTKQYDQVVVDGREDGDKGGYTGLGHALCTCSEALG